MDKQTCSYCGAEITNDKNLCIACGRAQVAKQSVFNESEAAQRYRVESEVSPATKSFGTACLVLIAIPVIVIIGIMLYASAHPGWKPFI